jgi:hypothetical protein
VCRAAKSDLHHHSHGSSVPYAVLLLLLAVAIILAWQHIGH